MKKKSILLFLYLFTPIYFLYAQQITTDNTQQPNALIQNLIGSDCVTVSNVSSAINGSVNNIISYGTFNSNTSNFPLQNGIILSTGHVNSAGNTINAQNLSEGNIDWVTDPDIFNVLGIDKTVNATAIEFNFSSANNFIAFNYLFASEEYQQEFPCNFQDVFAILIKQSGTTDPYVNIAVVPETTAEVSTNTIHPNISGFCEAQNADYFQGYNIGDTNFNGRTEVLTARADIIPNVTYHIKLVIADHIDQRFDSAVFIESEGFGNSINLGPDQSICGSDLTLNADINNPAAIYTWLLNGSPIVGASNSTLEVTQSGTYDVEISIPLANGSCTLGDSIDIEIQPYQDMSPIEAIEVCDPAPSDGIYAFDFTAKTNEIFASLPSNNYIISYHPTESDAQNNTNTINGIYENTEQIETIFVRIESLTGDCLQIGNFEIIVKNSPNAEEYNIEVCNGSTFTELEIGLGGLDLPVSDYEFDTTVTYHLTEEDALNAENEISDFPDVGIGLPGFYARIESIHYDCASIAPIYYNYVSSPEVNRMIIDNCLDPMYNEISGGETIDYNNLVYTYNIFELRELMEAEYPGIEFDIRLDIQEQPDFPIVHFSNSVFRIPFAAKFPDTYCFTNVAIEVHKNLLYNLLGEDNIISRCDDLSNDGVTDVDLAALSAELKNGYNDVNLVFYETEEDRTNQNNPLDPNATISLSNNQSLFIASSYKNCTLDSKVSIELEPIFNLEPQTIDYCGRTDPFTNITTIAIPPLVDLFLENLSITGSIEFYSSYDDAENQENEITENYDVNGSQQVFFIRMTNLFSPNSCYNITTLQVNISNILEGTPPAPLIICDDDQDGVSTLNLETIIPQLSNGNEDITFTFYQNYDDAVEKEFAIENPDNYTTNTTSIFIRAERLDLDCFTIFPFEVNIYANPQLPEIIDFINCEANPSLPSGFLFANRDEHIINGQMGMNVLYFETEENALNRTNPIDKNSAYYPTSNPQTVFIRLENEAEYSCFKIAPMQLEVRQAPIYNTPTDVFECDINKTGLATTDLADKIIEISTGITTDLNISFHLSPLNADIGSNEIPLNFTATSNPQVIYARIENPTSGCYDTPTFTINTLSLPEVIHGQSLTQCGNNSNYMQEWDLTEIELKVLNGRQYNIGFSYFETEDDLITGNNPIPNPEAYINTSNLQTIFAKIINTTTGCFNTVPFELITNNPPQINAFETYSICENDENKVDLSEINNILRDDTYNVIITYYLNEADAEAKVNPLNSIYSYNHTTETLFARVEFSTTKCYLVYPFQLVVLSNPVANQPNNLMACDTNFDGYEEFDLTQQNTSILGNQSTIDVSITYYDSEVKAIENQQPLNTQYLAYNNETIYARVENTSTGCYAITEFSTIIYELPVVSIEDQTICLNNLPLTVSANTYNSSDTYLWSTNETSTAIEIFETGTYSVTVTNAFGCENTSTFNVTESDSATIEVVDTIDFSDPNNITVTVNGIGNYLYQLNNGPFQLSNVFQNVPIGYNTITVIDQNGCATVTQDVLVIDTPKHMTPNDDGNYDTWHITGVETLPGTIIYIFDRYGKLLKELKHNSLGWDGIYNGKKMPAGDYWFIADVIQEDKQFQIKGHFTLKR